MERSLNVQEIDMQILRLGWNRTEAALRLGVSRPTLNKVLAGKNVKNTVIIKLQKGFKGVGVDMPLEQLVIWSANGDTLSQR